MLQLYVVFLANQRMLKGVEQAHFQVYSWLFDLQGAFYNAVTMFNMDIDIKTG